MVRSGALALGAFLIIGGVSAAEAADISDLDVYLPLGQDIFPSVPQNWSDLPFKLTVSQSFGYNSNVYNTPGAVYGNAVAAELNYGKPVGAFVSNSNFTGSTTYYWGAQQLFLNGSYGFYRYIDQAQLNTAHNTLSFGMNWVLTSKCTGTLAYSHSTAPSAPGQQVSVNALNVVTSQSFSQTANCVVNGNWSAIFNTGWSQSSNSAYLDQANNVQSEYVSTGVNYALSETQSLQLLGTVTYSDYSDRQALLNGVDAASLLQNAQVLQNSTLETVNLSYTRNFGPNLSLIASVGGAATTNGVAGLGNRQSGFKPQYSLSANWTVTPKLTLNGSIAQVATPPTAVVGDVQTNQSASIGAVYAITPKISFNASGSVSRATAGLGTTPSLALQTLFPNLTQTTNYGFSSGLNYSITPFLGASLSYSYNRSVQQSRSTPTSSIILALNFAPY